jgi:predicted DNA-binding antitoxin AbrB/MazE fold protein
MSTRIEAVFENGVFRPVRAVPLAERQWVTLTVEPDDPADRVAFTLSPEDWQAFCAALDAPARDLPELRRLLTDPGVFDAGPAPAQ